MTVNFYRVTDAPNVVTKNLGQPTTFQNVDVFEPCDVLTPTFIMRYTSNVTALNYLQAFGRYYFITNITLAAGDRAIVQCAVDVLTTYQDSIKSCTGTVLRAENPKTRILRDNKFPLSPNVNTYSWLFPQTPWTAQNGWNYLITTAGGVDNGS